MDRTTEREPIQPGMLRKMEKFGVKVMCHLALIAN